MATTIGSKLAAMERDCQGMVTFLNNQADYRSAAQVQSLLQQVGNTRQHMEQGDPKIADQEFPAKA